MEMLKMDLKRLKLSIKKNRIALKKCKEIEKILPYGNTIKNITDLKNNLHDNIFEDVKEYNRISRKIKSKK